MSSIQILGAYGTRSAGCGSSAFLLSQKHLLDAGHLLAPLQEKSAKIETIWLTHTHLDHICDIAYILDNYYELRTTPLRIRGLKESIDALKEHFFNHQIWPDFSNIALQNQEEMSLVYEVLQVGEVYSLDNGFSIEAFRTDHTVPSCGYIVSDEENALLISADTYSLESVVKSVQRHPAISAMVIECSFPSGMEVLAKASKHLTPALLFEGLQRLQGCGIKLYINHIKPSYKEQISRELHSMKGSWDIEILDDGDEIVF